MNKKDSMIKVIGLAATIIGMGATLLSSWVEDKKMEEMIDTKVNDALAEHFNGTES